MLTKVPVETTDIEKVRRKIIQHLGISGWAKAMYSYWDSVDFLEVLNKLKALSEDNKSFVPDIQYMFNWMKFCPYEKIRCVIMVEDRWKSGTYRGIPLSMDEELIKKDVCTGLAINRNYDIESFMAVLDKRRYGLEPWCRQGVLMFPISPTSRTNGNPHTELWSDFRARVIEAVEEQHKDLPWLLVQKPVWKYENLIQSKHTIPMKLYPEADVQWDKALNKILVAQGKEPVVW